MFSDRIGKAIELAASRHDGQYRKNPERRIPYVAHPFAVGMMPAHYGYPEDVVIAGILHDTVEDTGTTLNEIERDIGERAALLVEEVSEKDKSLPWEERKARYIEHLKTASAEARAISCCDKIHNMKGLIESARAGSDPWKFLSRGKEKQIDRYARMLPLFRGALKDEMVREYEEALRGIKAIDG